MRQPGEAPPARRRSGQGRFRGIIVSSYGHFGTHADNPFTLRPRGRGGSDPPEDAAPHVPGGPRAPYRGDLTDVLIPPGRARSSRPPGLARSGWPAGSVRGTFGRSFQSPTPAARAFLHPAARPACAGPATPYRGPHPGEGRAMTYKIINRRKYLATTLADARFSAWNAPRRWRRNAGSHRPGPEVREILVIRTAYIGR